MSWRLRLSVETILRLIPAVLVEGTLDDRTDESAAPANPPLQRTGATLALRAPSRARR